MSDHVDLTEWWSRTLRPARRKRFAALVLAVALIATTTVVWLSPSVATPGKPQTASAEEVRLSEENTRLRAILRAREQQSADLARSQAKAQAERKAAAEQGAAKAEAEKQAAAQAGQQKAAAERAAAAQRSKAKAASERAAAAARGKAQDRAEQAEAEAARARAALAGQGQGAAGPVAGAVPVAPALAALKAPTTRQFGLYTAQSPFSWSEFDDVAARVGAQPTVAGYFQGWDGPFRADAVTRSWQRGVMPMITWESRPLQAANDQAEDPAYSLKKIIDGSFDDYLRQYARDVVSTGLPMAIRMNHEMNGSWYPWAERTAKGEPNNGNGPGDYVASWRHVHDIFEAEGANQYVLWVWAPNIVNTMPGWQQDGDYLRSLYPGDDYVDWVGLSGYYRPPYKEDQTPTFGYTFGRSLEQLRALTSRPVFLAEIGASETGGNKAAWVTDLFDALAKPENDDILGFAWFNHAVTTISAGERVTNDWRIQSRDDSLAAFVDGLHDPAAGFTTTVPTTPTSLPTPQEP